MKKITFFCLWLFTSITLYAQEQQNKHHTEKPGVCNHSHQPKFTNTIVPTSTQKKTKLLKAPQPADVTVTVESVHSVAATWKTMSFDSFSIGTSGVAGNGPGTRNIRYIQGLNPTDKTTYGYSYEELRRLAASPTNPAGTGSVTFNLNQDFYIHLYSGATDYVCGPLRFNWTNLGTVGNVVTPVVETQFGINGNGPFANWQATNMMDFYNKVIPIITQIYGPAAHSYNVGIINDGNSVGTNMFMNGPNWIYSTYMANGSGRMTQPRLMVHELMHAWRDNVCISMNDEWHYDSTLSGFEEGMAEAAAQIVMNKFTTLYPNYFTPADLGYLNKRWGNQEGYAFDWDYDFQNHPQLTNANFFSSDIGTGAHWERYGTGAAVFYKMYIEDNDFFKKFNAEYYRRLNAAQSNVNTYTRADFINILQTVLPKVEEETMTTWVEKQRILDCKVVPGKKVHMLTFHGADGPRDMGHDNRIHAIETQNNADGDEWSWDIFNASGALLQRWFHQKNNLQGRLDIINYNGTLNRTINFRNNNMGYGGPNQGPCTNPNFNGPGPCFPVGIDVHNIYTTSANPAINNGGINDGQWYVNLGRPANGVAYMLQTDGLYRYNIIFTDGGTFSDRYYRLHGNSFINRDGMYAGVRNNADTPVTGRIYAEQKNKINPILGQEAPINIGAGGSLQASRIWASIPETVPSLNGGRTDTRYSKPGKVHIIYVSNDCSQPQKIDFRNISYGAPLSGVEMFLFNIDEFENITFTETMPATACQNSSVNFSVTNNWPYYLDDDTRITYRWLKDGIAIPGAINKTFTIANAQPTDAGTYTLEINSFGCIITRTQTLTIVPAIVLDPQVISPQNVCIGDTINLDVTGTASNPLPVGTTFSWSGPNGYTNTTKNPTIPNAQLTESGTYTVTCTVKDCNGNDIIKTASINVAVNTINTATISCGTPTANSVTFNWTPANTATAYDIIYQINSNPIVSIGNINNTLTYTINSLAPNDNVTITVTPTGPSGTCFSSTSLTCQASSAPICIIPTANLVNNPYTITCSNPSVTLDGSGSSIGANITYKWTGPGVITNDTTLNPTVSTPGTYTLRVTNILNGGCYSEINANVIANNNAPIANAGADVTVNCNNPSTTLNASGGVTYNWSPATGLSATNIANPIANPTTTTTYTVTVTAANGCTSTDTVVVTVDNNAPVANAGADVTVNCNNPSTTLNASGGVAYNWSPATGLSATNIANPIANPTTTTTYTVTVTAANGCTSTDTVVVTVDNNAPIANAGADVTVNCNNPSTTLNASGGVSYNWSPATGLSATNIANPIANPTTTTTYTVTVTAANGCTSTDTVVVTVDNNAPIANAGADVTVNCNNPSTTLNASGGVTYNWSPATGLSATNIANPIANPTTTTTYTVTVTAANGCTSTDTVVVTVDNNAPVANAGADVTVNCNNPSTTLNASGGVAYNWSPATGLSATNIANPIANPTTTTTYTVTVTAANGCTSTDTVVVTVDNNAPVANAGADVTVNCNNPSTTLNASGGVAYNWSPATGLNATNIANPIANPTTTTTYTVTVTAANGCTSTDTVVVTVDNNAPVANAGADVTLNCNTITATLGVTTNIIPNHSYIWSKDNITVGNTPTLNGITTAGIYILTVTNLNSGCSNSDEVEVKSNTSTPIADAGSDNTLTCITPYVTLGGLATTTTDVTYTWTRNNQIVGQEAFLNNVSIAGTYKLSVKNKFTGCIAEDTVIVTEDINLPQATVNQIKNNEYSLEITGGQGPYTHTISNGAVTNPNTTNFFISESGYYTITVKDAKNCEFETTVYLEALSIRIPDYFSPNGDGQNDTWYPINIEKYPKMEVLIFDRYQREIIRFNGNKTLGWDGNYNKNALPSGDYWYIIKLNDNKNSNEIIGGITLVR